MGHYRERKEIRLTTLASFFAFGTAGSAGAATESFEVALDDFFPEITSKTVGRVLIFWKSCALRRKNKAITYFSKL